MGTSLFSFQFAFLPLSLFFFLTLLFLSDARTKKKKTAANISAGWQMRPWNSFFETTAFKAPKSTEDWQERILNNLNYYRMNYAVLFLACLLLMIYTYPSILVASIICAISAGVLLSFKKPIVVAGRVLTEQEKMIALGAGLFFVFQLIHSFFFFFSVFPPESLLVFFITGGLWPLIFSILFSALG
jgi:hypothetical protein